MVVMFLYTLRHNVKNRIVQKKFGRSGKTVCAALHAVLTSILRLHQTLYQKAFPVPEHSQHPHWKHFKNYLGALDGTHVKVRVNIEDQPRYRNRKGEVSINVLGVCNPDSQFMYCLAGWEGSAHDARVLRDALAKPNGLKVPKGQYYLCDAGYANCEGFLTPFRGQCYHLKEWGQNRPRTPEEYYNMKHACARNVIERAFGLLKCSGLSYATQLGTPLKCLDTFFMHVASYIISSSNRPVLMLWRERTFNRHQQSLHQWSKKWMKWHPLCN
ncbi:Putative nuclease HARBI1 [Linum perenne]